MTACALCDLPTPDPPVTDGSVEGAFCCRGCLAVARALGDGEDGAGGIDGIDEIDGIDGAVGTDVDPAAVLDTGPAIGMGTTASGDGDRPTGVDRSGGPPEPPLEAPEEEAFLAVDGMHCATCEAFVEARATDHDGVLAAAASYPAGLVRLVYDPAAVDRAALPGILSGLGYRAREADDPAPDGDAGGRLLVGAFFGMMTMLPYALFLYPAYLGVAPDRLLVDLDGPAGRYLLWNVWLMATVVLGYTGFPLLRGAYVSLRAGRPNMDLLVALAATAAYLYSTLLAALGGTEVYFDIAVVVILAVTVGTRFEQRARRAAAGHLTDLTRERASTARCRRPGGVEEVPVDDLASGDEVVVRAGERLPVDGTVVEGRASLDESLVTGESSPVARGPGDDVLGGTLVTEGGLVVAVAEAGASTVDRLVRHLWAVQSARPGATRLADRLAAVFVPLAIGLAVAATGWHLATGAGVTDAVLTGLSVLVVSCPCALGLATPLAVAAGIRDALDDGVVITDPSAFERAPAVETVALDKTGTLTTGEMRVVEATDEETLRRAAAVEQFADHPFAEAVAAAVPPPDAVVEEARTHPGRGASGRVDGTDVVVGRPGLFEERGWALPTTLRRRHDRAGERGRVAALVGWNGAARGLVVAEDRPRPGWEAAVSALAADRRVVVVTGDGEEAASRFRGYPDVDAVFAGVPPEGKAALLSGLRRDGPVAMVGDGTNDALALAAADVGVAIERAALAADAADAVVTTGDLRAVSRVFSLTAATNRRIRGNLGWALCYNAVALPLAAAGLVNPLLAAVAMAASSLLVVANSARPVGGSTDGDAPGTEPDSTSGIGVPDTALDSRRDAVAPDPASNEDGGPHGPGAPPTAPTGGSNHSRADRSTTR